MTGLQRDRLLSYTANPDQANPDQANPDQVNPDQANPDQANPDQANPNQANPNQVNPDQANLDPDQANPDQANPDQANPDQANPDPNPGNESPPALVSLSPSLKWTVEKSVRQIPARSSASEERMLNGFFVNNAILGYMHFANTLPSKLIRKYICHNCKC